MVGPATRHVLGHAAGEGDETSAVHVDENGVVLLELLGFVLNGLRKEPEPLSFSRFIL